MTMVFAAVLTPLAAQTTTAIISGTVTDASGAVVAGAKVDVKNTGTGITQSTVSDSQGRFRVPELRIGDYEVQVTQAGFQTIVRKGISLTVGSEAVIDVSLPVGQAQQTVTVEGQASQVDTTSAAIANLVEQRQMRELPLNGRNFTQLFSLAPGVQVLPANGGSFYGRQENYSISGSRPIGQLFLVDNTNFLTFAGHGTGSAATGSALGLEAIAEFQTLTNTYSAQFGGNGAVINAASKSGTNDFHGSAYEFLRNSALDARNFFDNYRQPGENSASVPSFRRNQYGASLGGPVQKDKAFFFVNYEGLRQNLGQTSVANVPDANAHNGFLPCATAGSTYTCNPATGLANVGVSPAVASTLALFPVATTLTSGGVGTYAATGNSITHEDYFLGRFDYNFSDTDSILARYVRDRASFRSPFSASSLPLYDEKDTTANDFATIEERHIFTPTLVNLARVSFLRPSEIAVRDSPSLAPLQFFPGRDDGRVNVTGLTNIGSFQLLPYNLTANHYVAGDDVIWTSGAHSIRFGVNVDTVHDNTSSPQAIGGTYVFQSLLNFLQGSAFTLTAPLEGHTDSFRDMHELLVTPYIQDEWKVSRRLTLNLGMRYEWAANPSEKRNKLTNVVDILSNTSFVSVPKAFQTNPATGNWAPRFGFAYDPFADHKTSIRGGFGMFNDVMYANIYLPGYWLAPPFTSATQRNPTFPLPFGSTTAPALPTAMQGLFYGTDATPYMMQYNFNIQRDVGAGMVLTAGYVGSRGVHLLVSRDYNPPVPVVGPNGERVFAQLVGGRVTSNARINSNFGFLQQRSPMGNSDYNSLQVSLNRRFADGLQMQASYTYSKSMDYGSAGGGAQNVGATQGIEDPFDASIDKGRSTYDRTHSFRLSSVYAVPFHGNPFVKDWRLSGIFSAVTGPPFSIFTGFDQAGLGIGNTQRPNLVAGYSGNPVLGNPNQWFDPKAFSLPAVGTYGNLGRTTAVGPGLTNLDIALARDFPIRAISEGFTAQFRAEAFNIFNHANFGLPNNSVFVSGTNGGGSLNPTAGQITSAAPSRQLQFALKLIF